MFMYNKTDHSWIIGACMNLVGSVFINLGTNLMKLGHLRALKRQARVALADAALSRVSEEDEDEDLSDITVYKCCQQSWIWVPSKNRCRFRRELLSKTWVIGFTSFFIGNLLNFFSFGYAAQSLLASLGSVQFVTNVIFARVVLKEAISTRVLFGTCILIIGVALVVVYSCHGNPATKYSLNELIALFVDPHYIIYLSVLFCLWVLCQFYLRHLRSTGEHAKEGSTHSKLEAISYAAVSAIIGAQAVTFFKIVSELMAITASISGNDDVTRKAIYKSPFSYCVLFAAIFTSLFWIHRLNEALRLYDVLFIIPVFQVMWVILSVVGGGIFFHEFEDECFHGFRAFMFVIGLLTIIFGVFLLSMPSVEGDTETIVATPDENRSPLLRHDSIFASGGGMSLPTPSLTQALSFRSLISPMSSRSCSPEPSRDQQQLGRTSSSLSFGFTTIPVASAIEERERRSNSTSPVIDSHLYSESAVLLG